MLTKFKNILYFTIIIILLSSCNVSNKKEDIRSADWKKIDIVWWEVKEAGTTNSWTIKSSFNN